jgi:Phosphotransferase enzyme family
VNTITDAGYISNFVGERLMAKGLLDSPVSLQRHMQGLEDPDSKLVFLNKGRHGFVVTVSPSLFPEVVAEECLKAARMRSQLGDLGTPILEPLDTGRIHASSYAVLPYRKPLSRRRGLSWLDRMWVRRHLLEWLLQVTRQGNSACAVSRYEVALQALCATATADGPTAALLRTAEKHMGSGHFAPRACPMHGDLWKGNVLHGAASTAFTLVDWRGSEADGFPLFDLIRAAESFGLSPKALQRELQLHRAALRCRMQDLPLYLLGALGHYASHLGEMSRALFLRMADDSVTRLLCALEAPAVPKRDVRKVFT